MIVQGTSVGLDVHALSVVAHAIDEETGKIARARLCPDHREVLGWLHQLRAPVRVTYEAGPTGFGLARAINNSAGMECLVAAPSKLQRPAGDRIKTDAKDAAHLARLLRLDEITAVTVPAPEIEAVRDLVRARDDARADLMRVRHRLSKLLLARASCIPAGHHGRACTNHGCASNASPTAPHFADRIRGATREERFVGTAVPNFLRKPYGPGWALVGDAGYHKDFITAQGIQDAFRDAERCATALHQVFSGARSFEDAMGDYQVTRDGHVLPMYEFTTQLATLEPPPPDLQQLLGAVYGNHDAMDGFARVNAGVTSPAEYFADENVERILATVGTRQAT